MFLDEHCAFRSDDCCCCCTGRDALAHALCAHTSTRAAQGPALDADAKRASGRAYAWIERLLQSELPAGGWRPARGSSRDATARSALRNLLAANPDALALCLDQCYAASAPVARAYFQARRGLPMTLSDPLKKEGC